MIEISVQIVKLVILHLFAFSAHFYISTLNSINWPKSYQFWTRDERIRRNDGPKNVLTDRHTHVLTKWNIEEARSKNKLKACYSLSQFNNASSQMSLTKSAVDRAEETKQIDFGLLGERYEDLLRRCEVVHKNMQCRLFLVSKAILSLKKNIHIRIVRASSNLKYHCL